MSSFCRPALNIVTALGLDCTRTATVSCVPRFADQIHAATDSCVARSVQQRNVTAGCIALIHVRKIACCDRTCRFKLRTNKRSKIRCTIVQISTTRKGIRVTRMTTSLCRPALHVAAAFGLNCTRTPSMSGVPRFADQIDTATHSCRARPVQQCNETRG